MKKICFVTGTRAEYGLLEPLIENLSKKNEYIVQLIITGSHLVDDLGYTKDEIKFELVDQSEEIEILLASDTKDSVIKSMGLAMLSVGMVFKRLEPDLLIVLGDRFEIFAIVSAASVYNIPIAHLHGGEITEGAIDDVFRHSITKMSHLHFTSTEKYRQRVIQMGEQPDRVFNTGAIGLDRIKHMKLLEKAKLEKTLGISLMENTVLMTYHPVTNEDISIEYQVSSLFEALQKSEHLFLIFTKANADTNGRFINKKIKDFCDSNPERSILFDSLGSLRYLSLMKQVKIVMGNSSSGIIEAPSFHKPVVNIGNRQKGRIASECVIHTGYSTEEIMDGLGRAQDEDFINSCKTFINPYGDGNTADIISDKIHEINDYKTLLRKSFYEEK